MKAYARCGLAMNYDFGFFAIRGTISEKDRQRFHISKDVLNFSIYMKVTIISLGRVKASILNEINENVIECQKEKTGGPDIISKLPSDNTQKTQKLFLDAPCEHDKKHDDEFFRL